MSCHMKHRTSTFCWEKKIFWSSTKHWNTSRHFLSSHSGLPTTFFLTLGRKGEIFSYVSQTKSCELKDLLLRVSCWQSPITEGGAVITFVRTHPNLVLLWYKGRNFRPITGDCRLAASNNFIRGISVGKLDSFRLDFVSVSDERGSVINRITSSFRYISREESLNLISKAERNGLKKLINLSQTKQNYSKQLMKKFNRSGKEELRDPAFPTCMCQSTWSSSRSWGPF